MDFWSISCLFILAIFVFIVWKTTSKNIEETLEENDAKIVIDPAKAFCQRMKFVVRLKKRMKEFKARKELKIN